MNIYWLDTPACQDPLVVGGKAANLGRLASTHPVPPGFCLAAHNAGSNILTPQLHAELVTAYARLGERCGALQPSVAVRSSAVDEDGQQASFAGQHESYLNVVGSDAVEQAVLRCLASAQTERALHYRRSHGLEGEPSVAVLVQQLVVADVSAVVFSADPRTGDRGRVVINATWGLGESLVGGTVTPDLFVVRKSDAVRLANDAILSRQVMDKATMTVARPEGTREVPVPRCMRLVPSLDDGQIVALARLACALEASQGWAVDLECAFQVGQLYLLQCRPITTLSN
ncbi:MAG: PEP/pyruvate-binding domain-containing protein [Thermoflexales bacterium]|nr:PEP/pyruvate-binding domain-containing protein [Thermoflexales bacterium]